MKRQDWERFKSSEAWAEIVKLLDERIELLNSLLIKAPTKPVYSVSKKGDLTYIHGVEFYQGAIDEVKNFTNLIDYIIDNLNEED